MMFLKNRLLTPAAFLCIGLSAVLPSPAQTSGNGSIIGTVTDASGATVPGSPVVIINTDTGISRTTKTNGTGDYTAPFLIPGHYEVILGGGTYSKVDRKSLILTVGQTLTIDAALTAGSVTTEVQVSADVPILDPDKTEVSQTIGQNLISNLPVNSRNWSAFVLNTPNVVPDGGSGLVSFRGISGLYNQNYVDGANNNQMLFSEARGRASGSPYVYSLDSIKEFQAETSNYSVEFGQAAGGQVNAITKSGSNQLHGDLFYYLRYPALNALDPQTKYNAKFNTANPVAAAFLLTQPIHQQQQFGGSVGGPLIKDRLFYFFTYDGFRRVGKALYYNNNTITQVATAGNSAGTVVSPTQCPTTITSAQCTSAVQFILDNAFGAPTRFSKQNIFFPRIDWHISQKNDMFVNYNWANFDSTNGYSGANTFSGSSPTTNGPTSYHERFLVAGLTTVISDRSINQIHFQYGRDLETAGANAAAPSVNISTFTYGMPNALPRTAEPDEHRTQFTDVFSTTHGHHTFKFGGDANIVHEVMINLFQGGGIYAYGGTPAAAFANWASDAFHGVAGNTDPYAGYRFTSFVQTTDILNPAAKAGLDDFWMKMFDGFAQDTWKITPKLTMTAGLRYDIQITPAPIKNNTNFPPLSTLYSSSIKNTSRFQPRVALSWEPMPGTVFRAGYGIFSGLNQGSTYYAMRVENGVIQVNNNYTGCGATCTATSAALVGLQFPNVPYLPPGPALSTAIHPAGGAIPTVTGANAGGTQSFHGLDPNFVPPYAHEMEFGLEQALPGKLSLAVGYVGTRGMRLPIFVDANLRGKTPTGARTYNVVNASGGLIQQLTVPVYQISDRIVPTLQSYNTGFSVANTWYHSMAVTVNRPFRNGLQLLANYTWAHSTDTGQVNGANGTFYGGDTPLDPNKPSRDNGASDTDIRNRGVISFVYEPKIMEGNFWVKHIVDDFHFSGGYTASGGQPIFLGLGGGTIYTGGAGTYASGGGIYGGAISSGSGLATNGRPPQIGRNSIYAPGYQTMDLRVSRIIPIWEKYKIELIGQAYNVANRRIITGVNSTQSLYTAAAATGACATGTQTPGTAAAPLQGCIGPNTATGASAFGAPSTTSNTLYGPRQLEVVAKFNF